MKDDCSPASSAEEQREAMRQACATRYPDGCSDTKVIDPMKENFPCTMPLSCATPLTITPAIMHNQEYATEYLAHVALLRELLEPP